MNETEWIHYNKAIVKRFSWRIEKRGKLERMVVASVGGLDYSEWNLADRPPDQCLFFIIDVMLDQKDACERCHGARGGIPGNENIVDGVTLCDYCHADDLMR